MAEALTPRDEVLDLFETAVAVLPEGADDVGGQGTGLGGKQVVGAGSAWPP